MSRTSHLPFSHYSDQSNTGQWRSPGSASVLVNLEVLGISQFGKCWQALASMAYFIFHRQDYRQWSSMKCLDEHKGGLKYQLFNNNYIRRKSGPETKKQILIFFHSEPTSPACESLPGRAPCLSLMKRSWVPGKALLYPADNLEDEAGRKKASLRTGRSERDPRKAKESISSFIMVTFTPNSS